MVGMAFGGGVGDMERGEAREVSIEPGLKRATCRERRGLTNNEVFE